MKSTGAVKNIVFFDSRGSVDEYMSGRCVKCASDIKDKNIFIAMNPAVASYSIRRGFKIQDTTPYFMNSSHEAALDKSKALVDWMEKHFLLPDAAPDAGNTYRDSFIGWTRFAIHHCLWTIEVVSNAAGACSPQYVSASSFNKKHMPSLYIEPEEKYCGLIVRAVAEKNGICYRDISKGAKNGIDFLERPTGYLHALSRFIYSYERFALWSKVFRAGRGVAESGRLLFYTSKNYNLDKLAASLGKECGPYRLEFLKGPVISFVSLPGWMFRLYCPKYADVILKQKKAVMDIASFVRKEADLFSFRGVSFASIIARKIEDNIGGYVTGQMLWAAVLSRFLRRINPAMIFSNGERHDDLILAEICKNMHIPNILISHGSHVQPKNEYERIEWGEHGKALLRGPFSHLALQSPLAADYLKSFPAAGKTFITGPLLWGAPVNMTRSKILFDKIFGRSYNVGEIKVVLHAGTPKRSKNPRFWVYETPDEYIKSLRELARVIEKTTNTVLIIKFRPRSDIDIDAIKELVPFSEKVLLSVDEPFLDVLGMSDLLVSFSSTTIEEALQNKIPVLLYGGAGRYQHVPAGGIVSGRTVTPAAVYHVAGSEDLQYAIRSVLDLKPDEAHFKPYIYSKEERMSLVDILKGQRNI